MRKRIISILTVLTLCLTLLPVSVFAQDPAGQTTVNSWTEFEAALKNTSYTVIKLGQDISSPYQKSDDALLLGGPGRELTIDGGTHQLTLSSGGIILGGNVTLQNLKLVFSNAVRNAIVANGHTLTLDTIANPQPVYPIHVFCGEITDYNGTNQKPAAGTHGKINY